MITEDYVSFDVAKLLKEKGFKEITQGYINTDREVYMLPFQQGVYELSDKQYPYPTLQMAMKWLREVHNLNVEVYRTACGYIGCIVDIPSGTDIKFLEDDGDDLPSGQYTKFEKACEAAIKYCIENLINK